MSFGLLALSDFGLDQITTDFPQMYLWASGGTTVPAISSFDPTNWHTVSFSAVPTAASAGMMLFLRCTASGSFVVSKRLSTSSFKVSVRNSVGGALSSYVEWRLYAKASAFSSIALPAYGIVTYSASGELMSRSDMKAWEARNPLFFSKAELVNASPVYKGTASSAPFVSSGASGMRIRQTSVGSTATYFDTGINVNGSNVSVFCYKPSAGKVFEDFDSVFSTLPVALDY